MNAKPSKSLPSWSFIAAAGVLVAVPIVVSIAIPFAPSVERTSHPRGWADSVNPVPTRVPPLPDPGPASVADPAPPATPTAEAATMMLETDLAALRTEKIAIETESEKLRKTRQELETFDAEHREGVSPALYSTYESARAAYNTDVLAFKSRAARYQMKVAELERRVDSLRAGIR